MGNGLSNYFGTFLNYTDATWDQMWMDMCQKAYNTWASSVAVAPLNVPAWNNFLKSPVIRFPNLATPYYGFYNEIQTGQKFPTTSGLIQAYNDVFATTDLTKTKYGGYVDPYPAYTYKLQFEGFHDNSVSNRPLLALYYAAQIPHSLLGLQEPDAEG